MIEPNQALKPPNGVNMPSPSKILRKVIRRLRASGRSWQEIADECGFKNRGQAHMVASGQWIPRQEREEEIMNHLSSYLPDSTEQQGMRIWEILKRRLGPQRAIPQREIARRVGIPVREVRIVTLWLLEEGYPVGSTTRPPYGLYRMTKKEHQDAYAGQLWARVDKTRYRAGLVEGLDLEGGNNKQLELAL